MSEPTETDALVARVTATLGDMPDTATILSRGFGADTPSGWRFTFTAADLRALLAQLEAAKRDSARLDAFDVWRIRADIVPYLTPTSRSVSFIDVKHGGVRLMGNGASIREALDNLASHPPTGAPENG